MRFVRFQGKDGPPRAGTLEGERVAPIEGSMFGDWQHAGSSIPLADVQLLAPVVPVNVLAIGRNYREHAAEGNAEVPKSPLLFIKATTTVMAPEAPIRLPSIAPDNVDYEAELAVVIGKPAKKVREADALNYVFGYCCGNDVSARDVQRGDAQWARGKSFDTFAPLGPWIETELEPQKLAIRGRLNGQLMQDSNTSEMVFGVAHLISFLSQGMTLLPGTVIMTGTPSGVGAARKPPVFLKPGDRFEVEIDGLGKLSNPVVAEE